MVDDKSVIADVVATRAGVPLLPTVVGVIITVFVVGPPTVNIIMQAQSNSKSISDI